jgi:hypothetical protein
LSGSPGSTLFFYKLKQHRFDKKNKKIVNGLQPDFLPGFVGSTGSHRIMTSSIFS